VQIVGITRESERTVQDFLDKKAPDGKTWAEAVTYRLALDADDRTNAAYMEAAGQRGIPTAFVIGREGLLDWIGHPMTMDGPLARIVAGQWDRAAAVAQMRQRERLQEVSGELEELLLDRQWDAALAVVQRLEEDLGASSETVSMRVKIMQRAGRSQAVSGLRGELVELLWEDARGLNELAWDIATRGSGSDLDLALKAALRGSDLTNHQDAAVLDTVARVYYEQGQLDEAIQWQRKAVQYNRDEEEIDAALRKYLAERQAREETDDDAAGGSDGA
jgi:tetratricopeptide (TPR) repeat protein